MVRYINIIAVIKSLIKKLDLYTCHLLKTTNIKPALYLKELRNGHTYTPVYKPAYTVLEKHWLK